MQPYPSVTNCGNTPAWGIENVHLPMRFVTAGLQHSPHRSCAPSTVLIEQHLQAFFQVAGVREIAAYCAEVSAFAVQDFGRPISVSRQLFHNLEAVSERSGYPLQEAISILLAGSARELCR